jgi:hypothetical protein
MHFYHILSANREDSLTYHYTMLTERNSNVNYDLKQDESFDFAVASFITEYNNENV